MKYITIAALVVCLTGPYMFASAQSMRPPTPQEKEVIDKVVHAVLPVMQRFMDASWQIVAGGADNPNDYSVNSNPSLPLNVAPFNDWQFSIRQNSPFWNERLQPLYEKLMQPPVDYSDEKQMAAYNQISEEYKNLKDVFVEVEVNRPELPVKPDRNAKGNLKIAGCGYAFKMYHEHWIGTDRGLEAGCVLAFGNWSTARPSQDYGDYRFHFIHPYGPFIENIVIILMGNEQRIKELLQKIDWNEVNNGLSR